MKTLGIIPARYGSTRLPGKPLIKIRGKTIIERVHARAKQARLLHDVIVATDDVTIYNHVRKFGGHAMMTRLDHESGTLRCAEVSAAMPGFGLIINIQGDEPLIDPAQIDQLAAFMINTPTAGIGTLIRRITDVADLTNPSVAKVVCGHNGRVLYFSRNAVPFVRDFPVGSWLDKLPFFRHVGMYAYRREVLARIGSLSQSNLEHAEKLEQLNWLYHGFQVYAVQTEFDSHGVDTPEDLERVERLLSGL